MDAEIAALAGRQFNRVSRRQLLDLGLTESAIRHRISRGRLRILESGVFAVAPVVAEDDWGHWMGATLTCTGSVLSHESAGAARELWTLPRDVEVVTRAGSGGPRRHGNVLVHRSLVLDADREVLRGVPITSAPRTILDLAPHVSPTALARLVREAVRLRQTTVEDLGDLLGRHRGRRGAARVAATLARYAGLPLERARSGAEVRALEVLREAGRPLPRLNFRIAGEEADLSWPEPKLIVEIDGGPFHLDRGEDLRKAAAWTNAGWTVRRIASDEVYEAPYRLLAVAPR